MYRSWFASDGGPSPMAEAFDPYYKWLGIPPKDQPPHHYRLLGIELFESDPDVIDAAANRQMAYVQDCATGPYLKESQELLNAISAARVCLLNARNKDQYDARLRARLSDGPPSRAEPADSSAPSPPQVALVIEPPTAAGPGRASRRFTKGAQHRARRTRPSLLPWAAAAGLLVLVGGGVAVYLASRPAQPPRVAAVGPAAAPVRTAASQRPQDLAAAMNAAVPSEAVVQPVVSPRVPAAARLPDAQPSATVPLERGGHLLFAAVKINGQDAGRWVVDTGAGYVGISAEAARRLKLPDLRSGTVQGALGPRLASIKWAALLSLGGTEFPDVEVGVFDGRPAASQWGLAIDGVIGFDVLAAMPFTIDYSAASLTFFDRQTFQPPPGANAYDLYMQYNQPTAEGWIERSEEVRLLLATGLPIGLGLDPAFTSKMDMNKAIRKPAADATLVAVDGAQLSARPLVGELALFDAGHVVEDVYAWVPKATGSAAGSMAGRAGVVGGSVLSGFKLTFDYQQQKVWAEPAHDTAARPRDVLNLTPLLLAAMDGDEARLKAALAGKPELEAKDPRGRTALLIAAEFGYDAIVKTLLEHKANVNVADASGETPLLAAVRNKRLSTIDPILAAGPDVNSKNKAGESPLSLARKLKHTTAVDRLKKAGAK